MKDLESIQKEVDEWASQFEKPYFSPLSMMATICEESGEVARVINCLYGDKNAKEGEGLKKLEEELGDLLFTIICMANAHNISLNEAFERKMQKAYGRDNNRYKRKDDN